MSRSKEGFQTRIWGPMLWFLLHTMSFNFPCQPTQQQRECYRNFYESVRYVLPCGACRDNLSANMKASGYDRERVYKNRQTLSSWVYRLHCSVNDMLHKPSPTFAEVQKTYEGFRAKCDPKTKASVAATAAATTHRGCTTPIPGYVPSRCVLHIVPRKKSHCETIRIDPACRRCTSTTTRRRRTRRRRR